MSEEKKSLTRRKFLATSLGCLATAGFVGAERAVSQADKEPVGEHGPRMPSGGPITRVLGRTGISLPIVNSGVGANLDPGLIRASVETGIRLFDTDPGYRNGRHEELLGRVFSRGGLRQRVYIITKVATREERAGLSDREVRNLMRKTFEGSLKRLKTDYVDILMISDIRDSRTVTHEAMLGALTELKKQGKTRFIGIATHSRMATVINAMVKAAVYDVVLTSINFTMADDSALLKAIDRAAADGIGVIAMKTQAGGYAFPNPDTLRAYSNRVVNAAALKWVCNNERITTSVPGTNNYAHMRDNFAIASNPDYSEEEWRFLSDNRIKLGMEFCRQCRQCVAACPLKADIPALMRTHMYVKQYADFELARRAIDSISPDRGLALCVSCGECRAECANSVNIGRKIEELKLIYA